MPQEPFIEPGQRPDLTINLDTRVGDLTVRQLSEIFGRTPSVEKGAEPIEKQIIEKQTLEKPIVKEPKDVKDAKDHKEPKDHKDQKDAKDHKDPKDAKEQKDTKDQKEQKDTKDTADSKHVKDPKEHKDDKDLKDRKEHIKEQLLEKLHPDLPQTKAPPEGKLAAEGPESGGAPTSALEAIIERLSDLEKEVADLRKAGGKKGPAGA
jgi:hypothetical protein